MLKSIELEVTVAVIEDKYIYRVMVQKEQVSEWCSCSLCSDLVILRLL